MREIKFRAWNKEIKRMQPPSMNMLIDSMWGTPHWQFGYDDPQPMPDTVLMQFTGLIDKNNNEIWEGDIVSIPYVTPLGRIDMETEDCRALVGFEYGRFVVHLRHRTQLITEWCNREEGEYIPNHGPATILKKETFLTVIGNGYENPELVKI